MNRVVTLCHPFDPTCWQAFKELRKAANLEYLSDTHVKYIISQLVTIVILLTL